MELPRYTAASHGTAGSGTRVAHRRTSLGQWAVELLQYIAALPGGSGQWKSYGALPHSPGAVGNKTSAVALPWDSGQWNSCGTLPHCPEAMASVTLRYTALGQRAVGSGTCAVHCRTALGQWVVEHRCALLQCLGRWAVEPMRCTAALPGGSGQWKARGTLPHYVGALGSGTRDVHHCTGWGQWVVELLQSHILGAVDSGTLTV